jgi:glucose/mannose-6-phosphate isomerase
MDLDDFSAFENLDTSRMISHIRELPDQLMLAWELGKNADIPKISDINHVFICGAGCSATAAELVKYYLETVCPLPVTVWRDYEIPAWAKTRQTLMLISGFTGDEKELLSSYASGLNDGCQIAAIATGGELIRLAKDAGKPHLVFEFQGPARAALGFEFALPLAVLYRAGIIDTPRDDILAATTLMKSLQPFIDIDSPVVQNTAKRMAAQFLNRWITLVASDFMLPVANRWKSQINENAKAWAQVEEISEICHSSIGGIINPESILSHMMALFLHSPNDHAQYKTSLEAARHIFMVEGFNTDYYRAKGTSLLENIWTAIQFGDFISYYLAIAYGVDPTPVPGVAEINSILK